MSVHKGLKAFRVRKVNPGQSVPWARKVHKGPQASLARSV
jgi:hypothetical protein